MKIVRVILTILAFIYTLDPYDLLSDAIIGLGWMDDIILWGLLWWYFYAKKANPFMGGFYRKQPKNDRWRFGFYREQTFQSDSERPFQKTAQPSKDPYDILGIDRSASVREIKAAYRDLANKYHPDKVSHLGKEFVELAEKRFKEIQEAYQELMKGKHP